MRTPLIQLATIQQGLQFRGGVEASQNGRYAVVQIRDFDDFGELAPGPGGLTRIRPQGPVERYLVRQGDVLFLARGARNFACAISAPLEDTLAVGYFFILRPDASRVLPGYLSWYLNSPPARAFYRSVAAQGSHMPIVNRAMFETLEVPVPRLVVQQSVADLEEARRREARLMRRLEEVRREEVLQASLRAIAAPTLKSLSHQKPRSTR